jgi:hypothetical protein
MIPACRPLPTYNERGVPTLLRFAAYAMILFVGGCTHGAPVATTLATLPEALGLAARYPGDQDLRKDPAVVFTDDLETAAVGTVPNGFKWDHSWGGGQITREAAHVHAGRQALELSTERPISLGVSKYFSPGFDRLFMRYYIKYDEAFPGAHHVGGSIQARAPGVPDATPGIKADGTNKFTVLLDHWSFDPTVPAPGYLVAYVYHMDQQHEWGEQFYPSGKTQPGINATRGIFGPSFIPRKDVLPALGRWYSCELMVQANTAGQRDGRIAFWVDGRLAADFPNLRLRSVASLKINQVDIAMYSSQTKPLRRVWIDDVVVATAYIGPMTSDR